MKIENIPKHVAIIPDGNRRWAKKRSRPSFFGHQAGAKAAEKVLDEALKLGIDSLTLWTCSRDNLERRSKAEVNFLYKLFTIYFKKLLRSKEIYDNQIRVRILGRWQDYVPVGLRKVLEQLEMDTKNFKQHNLTFLMAYNGTEEMVETVKKIIKENEAKIDEKKIKANLWTKDLPPVDLVIRTGGEPHWSVGFMMWDCANAQFYFTEKLWPDFDGKEFRMAIEDYNRRGRRLGA